MTDRFAATLANLALALVRPHSIAALARTAGAIERPTAGGFAGRWPA